MSGGGALSGDQGDDDWGIPAAEEPSEQELQAQAEEDRRDNIQRLLHDIRMEAYDSATIHTRRARRWSRTYFVIGLPAAVLAAVAGATALASAAGRIAAGIIALISAALGAAAAFLNSDAHRTQEDNLAAAYDALRREATLAERLYANDPEWLRSPASVTQVEDMMRRMSELRRGKIRADEDERKRGSA